MKRKIKFGDCSIEYPNDPNNYLYRLGIGKFITGYWVKMKYRYSLKSTEGIKNEIIKGGSDS
jgi:hypothetical protein